MVKYYRKRNPRKMMGRKRKPRNYRNYKRRQYVPSKVQILQPISLKPKRIVRKVCYNNLIKVVNVLDGSNNVEPQFIRFNLNSPWLVNSVQYTAGANSSWIENRPTTVFTNDNPPESGTSFPGLFEQPTSIGNSYRTMCVVGAKWTFTYTPVESDQNPDSQPTALFGLITTGPSGLTPSNLGTNALYDSPYAKISKVIGFGNGTSGNVNKVSKGGFLQFKYSPKKYNFVKDITDSKSLWANNATTGGRHPNEIDRLTVGICGLMEQDNTRPLVSGILQVRCEATMLFGEPNNANNFADPKVV